MVNAVLSSKDHSGQVAELQCRIVKQTEMIGLVGSIIEAYDDKDAEAVDDSAYIHAVDEALETRWRLSLSALQIRCSGICGLPTCRASAVATKAICRGRVVETCWHRPRLRLRSAC